MSLIFDIIFNTKRASRNAPATLFFWRPHKMFEHCPEWVVKHGLQWVRENEPGYLYKSNRKHLLPSEWLQKHHPENHYTN